MFFSKILLSLRRWPHFRASAPSESCSRCSAGLISALPLVPNRAPAAALTSFPVPCHGMQCNTILRSAARCRVMCDAMLCYAMLCYASRCNTLWCNSPLRNTTPCYDILRSTVLFYARLCRPLQCSAYLLGIIALLDIRLCEYGEYLRHRYEGQMRHPIR